MRIALYCPNKPLSHSDPSGDLVIARGIHTALNRFGHDCRELGPFRSRWFWTTPRGVLGAVTSAFHIYRQALLFQPHLWLTYHPYYKSPDLFGPWISRIRRIPYVLFQPMYGTRRRKDPRTRLAFYLNRTALTTCTHAITNNINDIEALHRILPSHKVSYLPPGIFPEDFQRNAESGRTIRNRYGIPRHIPLLLTAARLRTGVKFQSMEYLMRALALLQDRRQTFVLMVVGDGPMEGVLRTLAKTLLPGKVIFAGRVPRSRMVHYYSAADLFVFPGIGESLGMVFLEAQASGLPVVALDTAGVPQVVQPGRTALLVDEDGGQSMARAIETLLENHQLRTRMAAHGPRFIHEERNLHRNYIELSRKLEEICKNWNEGRHATNG